METLEKNIINLRKEGLSYGAIQLKLGNPSKKLIKSVLKKHFPELLGDITVNYNKL